MTRTLVLALALLSFHASAAEVERVTRGNLAIEGIPEIPKELVQRLRRYQFARGATFAGWTPDGGSPSARDSATRASCTSWTCRWARAGRSPSSTSP